MTEDEILNMEAGEEMDVLVAERVMGWHIVSENGYLHWNDADNHFKCGVSIYDFEDAEDFHTLKWHPSESILWAQEVLEKIKNNIFGIFWENITNKMEWTVVLKPESSYSGGFPVTGETLELAICRAAILTKLNG